MTTSSDSKFGRTAAIGAIAASVVVGAVLFALYPNSAVPNYGSSSTTSQSYSGESGQSTAVGQDSTSMRNSTTNQNTTSTSPSDGGSTGSGGSGGSTGSGGSGGSTGSGGSGY